jgi:Uma2 family endonuclease
MPAPRLNTAEYLRTPETPLPQELVYGFVRDAPAPTPDHQSVLLGLLVPLVVHVGDRALGRVWPSPIDVVFDRERGLVVQPDIVMVSRGRLDIVSDRVWGPPDLVVEVLSPRPRIGGLDERLAWFARYGVRECWLVHQPDRAIEVLTFGEGRIVMRRRFIDTAPIVSAVLPEFRVSFDVIDARA